MMKLDINTTSSQIVFQGIRAFASLSLVGGMAILFIQGGTGVFIQSIDKLAEAGQILTNLVG